MTTLTFHTPSRKCAFRQFNDRPIIITKLLGVKALRRLGWRDAQVYEVELADPPPTALRWVAFADELFIEPTA